jgi:tRNA nucleotidyltransferase (CCA-adding enzyme)
MAYNETKGLIDLFGGRDDIKAGMIRCVGNPMERFGEDALRIMRAVRFSAQLGYQIETNTEAAIKELAHTLKHISVERIQVELVKLLVSNHPGYVLKLYELGLTKVFLPEFDVMMETPQNNPHHVYSVGLHTIKALELAKRDKIVRLTTLLHDIGKPATRTTDEVGIDHFSGHPNLGTEVARKILKRLRFDNDTIDRVALLVLYHDYGNAVSATPAFTRRLIHRVKLENFPLLLEVKRVDILAQSDLDRDKKLEKLASLNSAYQEVLEKRLCVSLKELAVSGSDLIQAGMKPGQELGKVLKLLLDEVLEEPTLNKKEVLIELTKRWGYV